MLFIFSSFIHRGYSADEKRKVWYSSFCQYSILKSNMMRG